MDWGQEEEVSWWRCASACQQGAQWRHARHHRQCIAIWQPAGKPSEGHEVTTVWHFQQHDNRLVLVQIACPGEGCYTQPNGGSSQGTPTGPNVAAGIMAASAVVKGRHFQPAAPSGDPASNNSSCLDELLASEKKHNTRSRASNPAEILRGTSNAPSPKRCFMPHTQQLPATQKKSNCLRDALATGGGAQSGIAGQGVVGQLTPVQQSRGNLQSDEHIGNGEKLACRRHAPLQAVDGMMGSRGQQAAQQPAGRPITCLPGRQLVLKKEF